jgi:hypothetical protein
VDGKQLEHGDIFFVDISGRYGPDPGKIENGRFQFKAKEGKKRVEISASKIFPGGAKGAGGKPVPEEFLSPEYNTQSKLTGEVKPEGPNEFEFKLHGRKNDVDGHAVTDCSGRLRIDFALFGHIDSHIDWQQRSGAPAKHGPRHRCLRG